jgi:hypothetical protein
LYFLINGVMTTMVLSTEWSAYGIVRKGLRVSTPANGSQCGVIEPMTSRRKYCGK